MFVYAVHIVVFPRELSTESNAARSVVDVCNAALRNRLAVFALDIFIHFKKCPNKRTVSRDIVRLHSRKVVNSKACIFKRIAHDTAYLGNGLVDRETYVDTALYPAVLCVQTGERTGHSSRNAVLKTKPDALSVIFTVREQLCKLFKQCIFAVLFRKELRDRIVAVLGA